MTDLTTKIQEMYEDPRVRELLDMGGKTAEVVDVILDSFAGFASMGDEPEDLINNLPDILTTALDQVNFSGGDDD